MGRFASHWDPPGTFQEPAGALGAFGVRSLQGARLTMVDPPSRAKTVTIKAKGKKPITFRKGALHRALGVPEGEPIPEGKKRAALAGRYGPKARRQANFAFRGALAEGRRTAAKRP